MAWPTIAVEIAYADSDPLTPIASNSWTDITDDVISFTTKRGRQDALGRVEAGTATVTIDNYLRDYDPANAAGSLHGADSKPMRKIRISATYSAVTYRLFTGFIEAWPIDYTPGGLNPVITLRCVDAFKYFANKKLNGAYSNEFSNWSIDTWLTNIGWPAADRALSSGQSQIQAGTFVNVPALQHFQNVADVENGIFFMDGAGRAVFHGRHYRLTAGSTLAATFDDNDSNVATAGHLWWYKTTLSYDDTNLWNEARITRTGGTEQVAQDTASQDEFFARTYTKTLPLLTDNEALSLAEWIVSRYATPAIRYTSMTLDGQMQDALWPYMLDLEISDRIHVSQLPPYEGGSSPIAYDCYIEGMSHTVDHDHWYTTFQLSSADQFQYWVLQDAVLGVLDSTTRLAY